MAGADLGESSSKKKKGGGGVKKPKRIGFKLDMTPLVDVAFLLLTFFMFATTMAQPQIMEMSVPPDITTPVEVAQSDLFTLYVSNKEHLFYNTGIDPTMRKIDIKDLKNLAVQKNAERENDLITSLKVDPAASYATVVNILDELNLAEGELVASYQEKNLKRERRFAVTPMTEEDKAELAKVDI
ncbi:MAG: biopolymer transporter ExbD [Chlorobi bacterium]|nr:MAG: Biopolymer transport protein ExbD/TolR [Chlorobi bacterium OLB7]MBK8910952.1 biopolymer transporter ExbD [Chlorobiota bacterium]MBX7216765.1 biopolymer transporter ExbD [Candidatus Kapabacteria bacterium]